MILELVLGLLIFSLWALPCQTQSSGTFSAALVPLDDLPLHTNGRYVVGRTGERVKLACVNWYGAHSQTFAPGGLEVRKMSGIVDTIVKLGFNCVRFPYSTEGQLYNPQVMDQFIAANPEMKGMHFQDIFDAAVKEMTSRGLMVIPNNQLHKAGWCCHFTQDEGLWYVPGYSEEVWIESLVNMTKRYKDNPLVVGMDLRNEVHDYEDTKLTWGSGDPSTDWALAATRAGNAVLAENPDSLIIVNGLCFGLELRPAKRHPIELVEENKVIYESHNYLEFNPFNVFSEVIMSWATVRIIAIVLLIAAVAAMALLSLAWRSLGGPRPKPQAAAVTFGFWLFVLLAILCAIFSIFVVALQAVPACHWWAMNDYFKPAVAVGTAAGLVLLTTFVLALWQPKCWRETLSPPTGPSKVDLECSGEDEADPGHQDFDGFGTETTDGRDSDSAASSSASREDDAEAETTRAQTGLLGKPEYTSLRIVSKQLKARQFNEKKAPGSGCGCGGSTGSKCAGDCEDHASLTQKRKERRRPVPWDRGLCCGLQCFCFCWMLFLAGIALLIVGILAPTYAVMSWNLDNQWGYLLEDGHDYTAPVWIGEFGGNVAGNYWINLMRYLSERDVDFAQWALNGKKWTTGYIDTAHMGRWVPMTPQWTDEEFGILAEDYETVRNPWLMLNLRGIEANPAQWRPPAKPCDRHLLGPACGG